MLVYMVEKNGLYYKYGSWVKKEKGQVWSEVEFAANTAEHYDATLEVLNAELTEAECYGRSS